MITFQELYEKMVGTAQRKKMARRMSKLQKSPAFQMKKKRNAVKMRDPAKLLMIARKKTIQKFRDKKYPNYNSMPLAQRVVIDQKIIQSKGKAIDKISKKLVAKLKGDEMERIKRARENLKDA